MSVLLGTIVLGANFWAELPGAFCVWLATTREADFLQHRLIASSWDVDELLQMREEIETKNLLKMAFAGLVGPPLG